MSVQTDLLGEYVIIPEHGDAGWIRAVWSGEGYLYVFVERDNMSKDGRTYPAYQIEFTKERTK